MWRYERRFEGLSGSAVTGTGDGVWTKRGMKGRKEEKRGRGGGSKRKMNVRIYTFFYFACWLRRGNSFHMISMFMV